LKDKNVDADEIMPMVTIRDPLFWLKSMCRHHYTAMWIGREHLDHCPNFLDKDLTTRVKYDGFVRRYDSLLDLWSKYFFFLFFAPPICRIGYSSLTLILFYRTFFFLQDAYYTEYINIDIPVRKNITPSKQTYDKMKDKIIFIRSVFLTAYHTVSFLSLVSSKLRIYYK
jgi:hypothetical protein